jgi:hypothetical protein
MKIREPVLNHVHLPRLGSAGRMMLADEDEASGVGGQIADSRDVRRKRSMESMIN